MSDPYSPDAERVDHGVNAWASEAHHAAPQPPAQAPVTNAPKPKRRGPKKMTDQPTTRFEGQLYPKQYQQASEVITRLKVENRSVASSERRRMTINTLVRIGMVIVLEHRNALHGVSEAELLESLRKSIAKRERGSSE